MRNLGGKVPINRGKPVAALPPKGGGGVAMADELKGKTAMSDRITVNNKDDATGYKAVIKIFGNNGVKVEFELTSSSIDTLKRKVSGHLDLVDEENFKLVNNPKQHGNYRS